MTHVPLSTGAGASAWQARTVIWILAAAAGVLALLTALGLFGDVNLVNGARTGPTIIIGGLNHAALGFIVSLCMWIAGTGLARLFPGIARERFAAAALMGYMAALPLTALVTALVLALPRLGPWLGAGIVLLSLGSYAIRPIPAQELKRAAWSAVAVFPAALLFGMWLGIDLHGPTAAQRGAPFGDLTFYAGMIWTMEAFAASFPNLGVMGETYSTYFNMLWPGIGGVLIRVAEIDPFLFLTAGGGSSYVLNLCLALAFFLDGIGRKAIGRSALPLLAAGVMAAVATPSWTVGSPPMVHALPLCIAAAFWCVCRPFQVVRAFAVMALAVTGALLSKVTLAVLVLPMTLAPIAWRMSGLSRGQVRMLVGLVAVIGLIGIALCLHFLPIYLKIGNIGLESMLRRRDFGALGAPGLMYVSREIALLLMLALCAWLLPWTSSVPLAIGGAIGVFYPWLFRVDFVAAHFLGGLLLIQAGRTRDWRVWLTVFALFLMALPAGLFTEPAGGYLWLVWPIVAAVIVTVAWDGEVGATLHQTVRSVAASLSAAVFMVSGLVMLAIASGHLAVADRKRMEAAEFTPAIHDIWRQVRLNTPLTALVFTDQVSEGFNLLEGWNTYAFQGQRQLYLSTWIASNVLRTDAAARAQMLATNRAVLSGARRPQDVTGTGAYSAFYAVMRGTAPAPEGWTVVYRNSEHVLYQMPAR